MQTGAARALGSLESLPIAVAMRHDLWLYPIIEIAHIAGFVVLVGSIVVLDLRLLGLSRGLPVTALTRHVLPWSFAALLMIVPTGLLMFIAHASDLIGNRAFQLKLLLILVAAVNAGVFHTNVYRSVRQWDKDATIPAAVRVHAAASIMLWFSVLSCGRLIAYL
jgi:hypothetical protein